MDTFSIHREAKSGNTFTSYIDFESVGQTTEKAMLLLRNPAASGKRILITYMNFGVDSTVTRSHFRTYITPTVTDAGTALSEINCCCMASPEEAHATAFKYPTVSSNGTMISTKLFPKESQSEGQNRSFVLDEEHDLLITVKNDVISINTFIQVYWVEL